MRKKIIKENKELVISIIFITTILAIIHYIIYPSLINPWTDEVIYIEMSRYLAGSINSGISGFYELMRPPMLPLLYSPLYLLGIVKEISITSLESLNIEKYVLPLYIYKYFLNLLGFLITFFLILKLTQYRSKKDKILAIISATIILIYIIFNEIYINYGGRIIPDPLSGSIALLSLLLILVYKPFTNISKKSYLILFISGLLFGLSFLTRFTQGLIFMVFIVTIILFQKEKRMKLLISLLAGFIFPLLIYNSFLLSMNSNLLNVLKRSSLIVKEDSLLFNESSLFYLKKLLYTLSGLFLLFIAYPFIKQKKKKVEEKVIIYSIYIYVLVFLTYLIFFFPLKVDRYLLIVLPGMSVIAGISLYRLFKKDKWIYAVIILLFMFLFITNISSSKKVIQWHTIRGEEYLKDMNFIIKNLKSMNIESDNYILFTNKVELGMYLKNTFTYIRWRYQKREISSFINKSNSKRYSTIYPRFNINKEYILIPIIDYSINIPNEDRYKEELKEFLSNYYGIYSIYNDIYIYNPR